MVNVIRNARAAIVIGAAVVIASAPADAKYSGRRTWQKVMGDTAIVEPMSIRSNHDIVLAGILLREHVTRGNTLNAQDVRILTGSDASFAISGTSGQTVSVSVPRHVSVTRASDAHSLIVETATKVSSAASGGNGGQLSSTSLNDSGLLVFSVQGTLATHAAIAPGAYRGALVATAQYN